MPQITMVQHVNVQITDRQRTRPARSTGGFPNTSRRPVNAARR